MKKVFACILVLGTAGVVVAKKAPPSTVKVESCGPMLRAIVPLPTKFCRSHGLRCERHGTHAATLAGSKDPAAIAEAAMFKNWLDDHCALGADATKAAADLTEGGKSQQRLHDMSKMDPKTSATTRLYGAALE